ncbi:MAG TPA: phospho-sugar mutase, partial [Kaistella chaponensis]|nr:phospho-sugar mutase [Kaistella chaponensis]
MYQYMIEIYEDLGMYYEGLVNVVKKGRTGAEEISQMMMDFRNNPVKELAGSKVTEIKDFQEQTSLNLIDNQKSIMDEIPKSNVLSYYTEDGTKVCIRPSGTEPKIKFYVSVKDSITSEEDFNAKLIQAENKIQKIKADLKL